MSQLLPNGTSLTAANAIIKKTRFPNSVLK